MTFWQLSIIILICLLAEGFFTGTEMAVVNADKLSLRSAARKGSNRAKLALSFLARPAKFFSTTLLGTNLSVVTASVCTTYYIVQHLGHGYESLALLLSPLLLIFGEIVPKSLYQHYANQLVLRITYPIKVFGWIFSPLVLLLSKLTDALLGKVAKQVGSELPVTRDELELLLKEGEEELEGDKGPARRTIITRIFDLADKRVAGIMIPLIDVEALSNTATREEAATAFGEKGYSRLPIYQERIFNIVGILNNIDLLMADEETISVKDLMRPAYYIPEGMPLDELLVTMKRKGEPMAVVVDEFGGASGIVTLEDVVEQVVGDIQDEYDYQPPLYYRIGKNRFLVSGRLEIAEANKKLNTGIPLGDYETIAGFLIHQLGMIPASGTEHRFGHLHFIVHRSTERAIQEIEIRLH